MRIISRMTADAGSRQRDFPCRLHVTGLAGDCRVRPSQRETETRMVEADGRPVRGLVARCAVPAIAALVNVILCMAAIAGHGRALDPLASAMALHASSGAVRAGQWETRIATMVEIDEFPTRRHVATFAFVAFRTLVHVVGPMAGNTAGRRSLEDAIGVTPLTRHRTMFSKEIEAGYRMIEFPRFCPVLRRVAPFATLSQAAVMLVVLAMTGDAGRGCQSERLRRLVAAFALDLRMGPRQRKIGQPVIEIRLVEGCDVEGLAFVIGMTGCTGSLADFGRLSMKTEAIFHV